MLPEVSAKLEHPPKRSPAPGLPRVWPQHSRLRSPGLMPTQHSTAPVCRAALRARGWPGKEKESQTPLMEMAEGRSKP